jgi:hypothetical protein
MPSTAARRVMVMPMPTSRASLSLVPNVSIAMGSTFIDFTPPWMTGVALARKKAPVSSAIPSTTPAARIPARAARRDVPRRRSVRVLMESIRRGVEGVWVQGAP